MSVHTDPLTFGQLLERHERELFAYALRLSGQRADAEDLYQDTFLAAFRAWPPPRRGNERAWLYRIATNRAIQRAAFVLRKVQGLGYAEIATALDCSEEAARARVSEALRKVKAAVA